MMPGELSKFIRSAIVAKYTNNAPEKNFAFELDFPRIGTYVVCEAIE